MPHDPTTHPAVPHAPLTHPNVIHPDALRDHPDDPRDERLRSGRLRDEYDEYPRKLTDRENWEIDKAIRSGIKPEGVELNEEQIATADRCTAENEKRARITGLRPQQRGYIPPHQRDPLAPRREPQPAPPPSIPHPHPETLPHSHPENPQHQSTQEKHRAAVNAKAEADEAEAKAKASRKEFGPHK